jgi:hypothetical protein
VGVAADIFFCLLSRLRLRILCLAHHCGGVTASACLSALVAGRFVDRSTRIESTPPPCFMKMLNALIVAPRSLRNSIRIRIRELDLLPSVRSVLISSDTDSCGRAWAHIHVLLCRS